MPKTAFPRAAVTAFLEPGGFGDLWVWRVDAAELMELCSAKPKFDPRGDIETLLLGGCDTGDHPGREALEDHFRAALAHPEPPGGLASGSAMSRRAEALVGACLRSLDMELGFLDLLIHAPRDDARLPRSAQADPARAMPCGFQALWGARALVYCGRVPEEDWDTYEERARAVLALVERSEIEGASEASGDHAEPRRL